MAKRTGRAAVAAFFLGLLLIGLATVTDYAGSYDEIAEQAILNSNYKEYAVQLQRAGIRWEYGLTLAVEPISESVERDHGISAYYPYALLLSWTNGSEWWRYTLWSVVTWLWFMAGVYSLYAISRSLGLSRPLSCVSALLLYLSPRFFAQGHFNNKDMVLLCQMLLCVWQGARFLQKMSFSRGLLFSVCGALACNTKIVGALPWGIIGLCVLCKLTLEHGWTLQKAGAALGSVLSFAVVYILLTPAAWNRPLEFFTYLIGNAAAFSRWNGVLYFRGAAFDLSRQRLPFYYLPYMMLVTLPLYTLPLALTGQAAAVWEAWRDRKAYFAQPKGWLLVCATLCWLLPVAAYVGIRPLIYNGWRHFYFCYAGIAVLAGYGAGVLWKRCARKGWLKGCFVAALCLCLGTTAVEMALNHPYQASYYNPLASRETMETDYWNTGGTAALKRLAGCEWRNAGLPLEVGCYFFDIQNARFKLDDGLKSKLTTTVKKDSPYLYYIENYVQVYNIERPEGYHVLFPVYSYGRLIGTMYERDQ